MLWYLVLLSVCVKVYCKKFIVVSRLPETDETCKHFVTENTAIIGELRYDFIESDEIPLGLEGILSVEEDQEVSVDSYQLQKNPIWGLDRIDQRSNDLNSMYFYNNLAGTDVWNYVLDTGIDISHPEFEGRAYWGINVADDEPPEGCMHPHGTHVAGTIGSKTYGVAKNTSLVSVKVLSCSGSGSVSGILRAIDWVAKQDKKKKVINMSLGGGKSNALDSAVEQITKLGVVVVVAAGNENSDACQGSPSSSSSAITVGAIDKNTYIASFSNWGNCVNIFAPGVNILSTLPKGQVGYLSGTSMACPHVSGVVSLVLDAYPEETIYPEKISKFLQFSATKRKIGGDLKNSSDYLVFSLASFVF